MLSWPHTKSVGNARFTESTRFKDELYRSPGPKYSGPSSLGRHGDVYPVTNGGKYFACLYLLVGCVMMAKALGDIAGLPLELRRQRNERAVLDQYGETMDASEFEEILASFRALGLAGPGEDALTRVRASLGLHRGDGSG